MGRAHRVLMIGAGGLGCAAGLALARSGLPLDVTFVDPDRVERSNLHRQVLFDERDLGAPKAERAAARVEAEARLRGNVVEARGVVDRLDWENALALTGARDLVIEGTDRHEAKFLAADAAALADVPIVHAGIVRWAGWALGTIPKTSACLRCVFEEVPAEAAVETCAAAGVLGAAVGVFGALQASMALALLAQSEAAPPLLRYDVRSGTARASTPRRRVDCPLCGAQPSILELRPERYGAICARQPAPSPPS